MPSRIYITIVSIVMLLSAMLFWFWLARSKWGARVNDRKTRILVVITIIWGVIAVGGLRIGYLLYTGWRP